MIPSSSTTLHLGLVQTPLEKYEEEELEEVVDEEEEVFFQVTEEKSEYASDARCKSMTPKKSKFKKD